MQESRGGVTWLLTGGLGESVIWSGPWNTGIIWSLKLMWKVIPNGKRGSNIVRIWICSVFQRRALNRNTRSHSKRSQSASLYSNRPDIYIRNVSVLKRRYLKKWKPISQLRDIGENFPSSYNFSRLHILTFQEGNGKGSPQHHPAMEVSSYRKGSCTEKPNTAGDGGGGGGKGICVCVFQTVELSFKLYLEVKFC